MVKFMSLRGHTMSDLLNEKLNVVISILEKVNANTGNDAETALMYIRKSTEAICSSVYENITGKSASGKMLNDFLNYFSQNNNLPEEITASIRSIQVYCNPAAHYAARVEQYAKAINPALYALTIVVDWFFKDYLRRPVPFQFSNNHSIGSSLQVNEVYENAIMNKKLRIGCIAFPPFMNFKKNEGKIIFEGYYYELFKRFGLKMGIEMEFTPLRNELGEQRLFNKEIDLIACWVSNEQRQQKLDFLIKNFRISIGGIVRKDFNEITSVRDLKNKPISIITCKGEIGDYIVHHKLNIVDETTNINRIETSDLSQLFKMVENGISDIAITDNMTCQHYLLAHPESNLKNIFLVQSLYTDEVGVVVAKKQDALITWIENEIKHIMMEKEMLDMESAILAKYENAVLLNG